MNKGLRAQKGFALLAFVNRQLELLFIAISFYSRLPVPKKLDYSQAKLKACGVYFPLVGAILAVLFLAWFYLLSLLFSSHISIALAMALLLWVTGAFHEDGFADFCDGFGGGYGKEQILNIMLDSRIGTYGAVGLVMVLLLRFLALGQLLEHRSLSSFCIVVVVAFTFSRFLAYSYTLFLPYARIASQDELTQYKAAFMQEKVKTLPSLFHAGLFALIPLLFLPLLQVCSVIFISLIIWIVYGRYLKEKIAGYTGDCLGAVQQIFELSIYLILGLNLWS